jgi:hypothetical protein
MSTESRPIEQIIAAAEKHGLESEPDMEVGDLQQLVRDLWASLTLEQQKSFFNREENLVDWKLFLQMWKNL